MLFRRKLFAKESSSLQNRSESVLGPLAAKGCSLLEIQITEARNPLLRFYDKKLSVDGCVNVNTMVEGKHRLNCGITLFGQFLLLCYNPFAHICNVFRWQDNLSTVLISGPQFR